MNKHRHIFCSVFIASIVPFLLFAQDSSLTQARTYIRGLMTTAHLPGVSVAVSVNDSIVWAEGFGYANVEKKHPVKTVTRFRIGSVIKLFTATAAARLHEQERLDLDAPIHKYLDFLPEHISRITTGQLLGHTSGIRHYGRNEFINRTHYQTVTEALSIFLHDSLRFLPGTRYGYSSYGYVLASAVIERAAHREFLEYMNDTIIGPLKLHSTMPDRNDTADVLQAVPYSRDTADGYVRGPLNDNSSRWGAGGWISTPLDLVAFGTAVFSNGFISSETRKQLITPQKTTDRTETLVGLGWRIGIDDDGNPFYYHSGDSIGGRAVLLICPRNSVIVALAANLTFARFGEKEALQIARLFSKFLR